MTTMGLLRELKENGVCAELYGMIRGGVVLGVVLIRGLP